MLRREFATAAVALIAAPAIVQAAESEEKCYTGSEVAQMIADWVYEDGEWKDVTFFHHFECRPDLTAVIAAGLDVKKIMGFLIRVNGAIESGLMPEVIGAGHAAEESEEEMFPIVTVFIVDADGFNRAMGMFADYFAQWPRPCYEVEEDCLVQLV